MSEADWDHEYDVVVVGSGAGGMAAAVTARDKGLSVLVIEKADCYGGTSAVSGGGIWVPCNHQIEDLGGTDSYEESETYLRKLTAEDDVPETRLTTYLKRAREMVLYMEQRFGVHFCSVPIYPDYFPDQEGSKAGYRTMEPAPFDASRLGEEFDRQREAYQGTLFLGRMGMSQLEAHTLLCREPGWIKLLFKLLIGYWLDFPWRFKTRRDRRQTLGQALTGSLRRAMMDIDAPLWLSTGLTQLVEEDGRVVGLVAERHGRPMRIRARAGVLLACGGFESNQAMREQYLPKPTDASWTAAPGCNHGDGIRAGQELGAATRFMDMTWGTPTVAVPGAMAATGLFIERALPRCVMVNGQGKRFVDEAAPYTEIIFAMYRDHEQTGCTVPCWFICDSDYRKKYPLGPLMPSSMQPDSRLPPNWKDNVYFKADSLEELADKIGVEVGGLMETIDHYNEYADAGEDQEFHKGENVFDRYYGDRSAGINPCLGPIEKGPFYALKLNAGELGTKGGLDADEAGRVMRADGQAIPGLYATGNCSAAVMGRSYAGPGATLGPAMTFGYLAALDMARSAGARAEREIQSAA